MAGRSTPPPAARPAPGAGFAALGRPLWGVLLVGTLLTLARFSEAFLILRAHDAGLPLAGAPLVLVVMNLAYALSAWPAGHLSDRIGRRGLLAAGIGALALADMMMLAQGLGPVLAGVAVWGLHMGLTQGLLAAEVAAAAPQDMRGRAFGLFGMVTGGATLAANLLAGALWAGGGAGATFGAGLALAALCLPALALLPSPRA